MAEIGDIWIRWVDMLYEDGEVRLIAIPYTVRKVTPCGVRLGDNRFVLNESRKRFACKTSEEALDSFVIRKKRQCAILRGQLQRAERALEIGIHKQKVKEWTPPLT